MNEMIVFVAFLGVCVVVLLLAGIRRKSAKKRAARTLASEDQKNMWSARHAHARMHKGSSVNRSPDSRPPDDDDVVYDGYSRRDRHHVRDGQYRLEEHLSEKDD